MSESGSEDSGSEEERKRKSRKEEKKRKKKSKVDRDSSVQEGDGPVRLSEFFNGD